MMVYNHISISLFDLGSHKSRYWCSIIVGINLLLLTGIVETILFHVGLWPFLIYFGGYDYFFKRCYSQRKTLGHGYCKLYYFIWAYCNISLFSFILG